jgi:hypothetical protein
MSPESVRGYNDHRHEVRASMPGLEGSLLPTYSGIRGVKGARRNRGHELIRDSVGHGIECP